MISFGVPPSLPWNVVAFIARDCFFLLQGKPSPCSRVLKQEPPASSSRFSPSSVTRGLIMPCHPNNQSGRPSRKAGEAVRAACGRRDQASNWQEQGAHSQSSKSITYRLPPFQTTAAPGVCSSTLLPKPICFHPRLMRIFLPLFFPQRAFFCS